MQHELAGRLLEHAPHASPSTVDTSSRTISRGWSRRPWRKRPRPFRTRRSFDAPARWQPNVVAVSCLPSGRSAGGESVARAARAAGHERPARLLAQIVRLGPADVPAARALDRCGEMRAVHRRRASGARHTPSTRRSSGPSLDAIGTQSGSCDPRSRVRALSRSSTWAEPSRRGSGRSRCSRRSRPRPCRS